MLNFFNSRFFALLFLTAILPVTVQQARAVVLQTGQFFDLQFTNLPYDSPTDNSPPDQDFIGISDLRLSIGAVFRVELFADNTSQSPFQAFDRYGSGGQSVNSTSWQDLQGVVRVTSITGIVDWAAMGIGVSKAGGQYWKLFPMPPTAPPLISISPSNITAIAGSTLTLSADGYGMPLTYQWQRNGTNITDATNSLLVLSNAQLVDTGAYFAVLNNSAGSSTTAVANVEIEFGSQLELQFRPVLTIQGSTGSTYRVESCLDLSSSIWTPLTNIVLNVSPYYFTDIQALPQQRKFYRVVSVP